MPYIANAQLIKIINDCKKEVSNQPQEIRSQLCAMFRVDVKTPKEGES